jgi:hypothetical protein
MDKIKIVEVPMNDGSFVEYVVIERGENETTTMTKAFYDEQQAQAEHFTPIVTSGE